MEQSNEPNEHNNDPTSAATNLMNPQEREEGDLAAQAKEEPDLTLSEWVAHKNPPIPGESPITGPPPTFGSLTQGYEERVMDGTSAKNHTIMRVPFYWSNLFPLVTLGKGFHR